jgi:hypothetical protein
MVVANNALFMFTPLPPAPFALLALLPLPLVGFLDLAITLTQWGDCFLKKLIINIIKEFSAEKTLKIDRG